MTDDDPPSVPVVCPECGTRSRVRLSELSGTVQRHNDRRHDGDQVAGPDPAVADRIAELAAADLGLLENPD